MNAAEASAVQSACIICIVVVSESLLATVLFPFIYQMVKGFGGIEDRYIGFWTGIISKNILFLLISQLI